MYRVISLSLLSAISINTIAQSTSFAFNDSNKWRTSSLKQSQNQNVDAILDLSEKTTILEQSITNEQINDIKESIKAGGVNTKIDIDDFDFENIKISIIEDESEMRAITVPMSDKFSKLSNLTILYDVDNNISTYSETIITKSQENTFDLKIYQDGEETLNEVTDIEYIENSQIDDAIKELNSNVNLYGLDIPCFTAVAGLGTGIGALIAKVCVGSCVSVVAVCAVCIGGLVVVGGGTMMAAIKTCWK